MKLRKEEMNLCMEEMTSRKEEMNICTVEMMFCK